MRAKLVKESMGDILKPKSKDDLIKQFSKLSQKEKNEKLLNAVWKGQLEIIKLLIEAGVDVNAKNENGYTALMNAVIHEYLEIAKLLIEAGADVNFKNKYGDTALNIATTYNYKEIVDLLKKHGAITESINDILKPKDPEYIKNVQKYFVDVLNSMLKNSQDLMSEINGIVNTNVNMINDIQYIFHRSKNIIKDNFENGISAEKTAKQILNI